jgi:ABC-2 type transport system ATP-binding protein
MIINRGKIIEEGTTKEIKKKSQGNEIVNVCIEDAIDNNILFKELNSINSVQLVDPIELAAGKFQIQSKADMSSKRDLFNFCVDKGYVLTEMSSYETSLEDIFRELTLN